MSYREATHTKTAYFSRVGRVKWRLDRVPRKRRHGTVRANFRSFHARLQERTKDVHRTECLQRLLSDHRCDTCIHVRGTHKVERIDVHCRQWCFCACLGSKSLYFAAKCHLEIQTAFGIIRSTIERRCASRSWWQIILSIVLWTTVR